jgi:hypothetical protein
MILVVMQQLRDPEKYEPAFRAIGLAHAEKVNGPAPTKVLGENPEENEKHSTRKQGSSTSQAPMLLESQSSQTTSVDWANLSLAAADPKVDQFSQMWDLLLQLAAPEVVSELAGTFFQAEREAGNQTVNHVESGSVSEEAKLVKVSEEVRLWLVQANERVASWLEAIESESVGSQSIEAQSVDSLSQGIEQLATPDTNALDAIVPDPNTLGRFPSQLAAWSALTDGGVPSASAALSDEVRQGLRIALDRRLLKSIRDASPWRSVERPSLLRTLQRASQVNLSIQATQPTLQNVLKVEVPTLTKQANDFRGRLVRMRGRPISNVSNANASNANPSIAEATSAAWGDFAYDVLWIYPDDNSQQPVCLYALKSPPNRTGDSVKSHEINSAPAGGWPVLKADQVGKINANSQSVEVTGFFIKRLAFASPRGVDIAPVIVVSHSRWVDDELPSSPTAAETEATKSIDFLSKSGAPVVPWVEPGVHRNQLRLLSEVLEEPLNAISQDSLQALTLPTPNLTDLDNNPKTDDSKTDSPLVQVLYQLPRLQKPLTGAIESNKRIGAAKLTRLSGIATEWLPIPLSGPQAMAIGKREVYRLKIEPIALNASKDQPTAPPVYALVNTIPSHWKLAGNGKTDEPIGGLMKTEPMALATGGDSASVHALAPSSIWQPVTLEGLLLETDSTAKRQIMLCDSPQWSWRWAESDEVNKPNLTRENIRPGISSDWYQLGAAGWDLSAIRFIQSLRGKPITAEESRAFYSLIDVAERISSPPKTDRSETDHTHPTITPFQALQGGPQSILGRVAAKIRIVRVTRIDVPEESNRRNLDGTEYYELDGLADIGKQVIQLKNPDGSGEIRFAGQFPMTLIAKTVPDWLLNNSIESKSKTTPEQNLQQGVWYPSINLEIEGIFYRLWSYSTGQTVKASEQMEGSELRQIGPLVAVTKWKPLLEQRKSSNPTRSLAREVMTALIVAAAIVWFFFRYRTVKK